MKLAVLFVTVLIETAGTIAGSVGNYDYPELVRFYAVVVANGYVIITCVY